MEVIQAVSIRNGHKIEFDNDVWVVLAYQHRTPGNYHPSMVLKVRSLTTGAGKEVRFNTNERVKLADIDDRKMVYSYHDGHDYVFMDNESFEQVTLTDDELGDAAQWLVENMELRVQYLKGRPIGIDLPNFYEMKVVHTEPAVKGDTATSVMKTAELECGASIQVPLFVNTGDVLKVDLRDGTYVERVKKG